jgi:hypothetical protein
MQQLMDTEDSKRDEIPFCTQKLLTRPAGLRKRQLAFTHAN